MTIKYAIVSISDSRLNNVNNIISIMGIQEPVKFFDISNINDINLFSEKYPTFDINQYLINKKYETNPSRSDGEMGCWMSHFNAWNYVLENDLDDFFVIEDDCFLTESKFKQIGEIIYNNSYELLLCGQWAEFYYLRKSAAEFLVENAFEQGYKKMPVDEYMFDCIREHGLIGSFGANIVSQTTQSYGSQINHKVRAF
jgi:hypothetical protein